MYSQEKMEKIQEALASVNKDLHRADWDRLNEELCLEHIALFESMSGLDVLPIVMPLIIPISATVYSIVPAVTSLTAAIFYEIIPTVTSLTSAIVTIIAATGDLQSQILAISTTAGGNVWGGITGNLNNQTDLKLALNNRSLTSHEALYTLTSMFVSSTSYLDNKFLGYSLTSHNHSLSSLNEKSYYSLTDRPTVTNAYAGVFVKPSIIDNKDGTLTLGAGEYTVFQDDNFTPPLIKYSNTGGIFSLTNNITNYIVFCSMSGIYVETDRSNISQSHVIPIVTVFCDNNDLHILDWDSMGKGLANKLSDRLVRTERFSTEIGGCLLNEKTGRYITLTDGYVWFGGVRTALSSCDSSLTSTVVEVYYHSGTGWAFSTTATYNNTQYDDGTGLKTLDAGRYAINWIYRGIENERHLFILLGNTNCKSSEVDTVTVPINVPPLIASQAMLVGKISVKKDGASGNVSSAFTTTFAQSLVYEHNDLANLDGGNTNQYYHLSSSQYTSLPSSTVPTSSTASGTAGTIRYDNNYIYICTTANTWKRASLTSW